MRWLLLLVLSGCALVASGHDVESPGSVHVMPTFVGPPTGVVLSVTTSYATLHVDAMPTRTRFGELRELVEHHREVEPGLRAPPAAFVAAGVINALDQESWIEDRSLPGEPASGVAVVVRAGDAVVRIAYR